MSKLDMLLLFPIAVGFIIGLFKGLIREVTSLAAILLGILGAKFFAPTVSVFLVDSLHFSKGVASVLSYLILFVGIVIALHLLAKSLEKVFDAMSLGFLNKFMGGIVGAFKYALLVSVLLFAYNAISPPDALTKENSIAYKPLMKLAPTLWGEAKEEYKSQHEYLNEKK